MIARYVCKTPGGTVEVTTEVTKTVDEIKALAEEEHKTPVMEVIEEIPLSPLSPEFEEYAIALRAKFRAAEVASRPKKAEVLRIKKAMQKKRRRESERITVAVDFP